MQPLVSVIVPIKNYERIRRNAWMWSKEITFDKSYEDFKQIIL